LFNRFTVLKKVVGVFCAFFQFTLIWRIRWMLQHQQDGLEPWRRR
jgi:hypothetical protein